MLKNILLMLIPLIFLFILGTAVVYLSRRIAGAFGFSATYLYVGLGVSLVGSLTTIIVMMRSNSTSEFGHGLDVVAGILLGCLFMLLLSTAVVDLLQLLLHLKPLYYGLAVLSLGFVLSTYSLWNATNTKVIRREVHLKNLQQPVRIIQLTDIHLGHFWGKASVEKLVKLIEKESVPIDAVVITGDLFDGTREIKAETIEPFKALSMPIYFVTGNHDGYSGNGKIKALLRSAGIHILDNKMVDLKGLQIVGLDYMMPDMGTRDMMQAPLGVHTIQEILPKFHLDSTRASVLLHHNPVGIKYANENGIGLYLAGHTHAGQIFPINFITALMFDYNRGLSRYKNGTQIYVSQGSGTFGPPMRLGTDSEITLIHLTKE